MPDSAAAIRFKLRTQNPQLALLAAQEPRLDDFGGRLVSGVPRLELASFPTPVERLVRRVDAAPAAASMNRREQGGALEIATRARERPEHGDLWGAGPRDEEVDDGVGDLEDAQGNGPELWIKRDDLTSPLYGGGKVRKLEWLLAEARYRRGPLLSVGAVGSHHLLALALFASLRDQHVHALTCPQPRSAHATRNLAALASLGTRIIPMPSRVALPWALLRERIAARLGRQESAAWVPAGASDDAGTLGFVAAGLELGAQIDRGEAPAFDRIYITGGTLGASVGLILGLALARVSTHVHVVAAVERIACNEWLLAHKLNRAARFLAIRGMVALESGVAPCLAHAKLRYCVNAGHIGLGYASPTDEARAAVALAALCGIELETTYTGKCLAAMLTDAKRSGDLARGERWLLWNTHGGSAKPGWITEQWRERVPSMLQRGLEPLDSFYGA